MGYLKSKERVLRKWRSIYWKHRFASCGNNISVYGRISVSGEKYIDIGHNFHINEGCKLCGREGCRIIIGDDVTCSANTTILSSGYDIDDWMRGGVHRHLQATTQIGSHVWLCSNVTVLPGVKISGEYVIVAAGAVVASDITDDYCLYAGVPARLVKRYLLSKGE